MKETYRSNDYHPDKVRRTYVSCHSLREDGEIYKVFEVNDRSQTIRELISDGQEIPETIKQNARDFHGFYPSQVIWKS